MKKITLQVLLGATLLALCSLGEAQQPKKTPLIGVLSPFSASDAAFWHKAFVQGLHDLGWIEGKNISIEYRYAEGRSDRLPELAADLVGLKVDVIVASVNTDALVAKKATRIIPIVMASAGEPVSTGLVESLARPGGNITGLSQMAPEMAGKRLELLQDIVPRLSRVAVLWEPLGDNLHAQLEGNPKPSTAAENSASFPGGKEPKRIRRHVQRRDQGARERCYHHARPGIRWKFKADRGCCVEKPPAVNVSPD